MLTFQIISVSQVKANPRETEHDTTFDTTIILVRTYSSSEYASMVGEKIYGIKIIGKYVYKAPHSLGMF